MQGKRYNSSLPTRKTALGRLGAPFSHGMRSMLEPASLTSCGALQAHPRLGPPFGGCPWAVGHFAVQARLAEDVTEQGDCQQMIDQIVFATDFSATSRKTLAYAAALARKAKASIIGSYALKPPSSIFATPKEELEQREAQHLQRLESFLKAPEVHGIKCRARLASGSPPQALGKLAIDEKADLILVAKRSRSTLEKFFVGSNTEQIVVSAPCPVLVAPDLEHCTVNWDPVLCPIDFSRSSNHALEWAIGLCRKYGASLVVLHAATLPEAGQGRQAALAKAEGRMAEALALFDAPPKTHKLILEGRPSEMILETAEQMKSDLVVMGRRGMNQGDYVGLGSTALAVLKGETFPLLLIPEMHSRPRPL